MGAIGVFDSGVGGITVLKALKEAFPQENFLYLGDTARLPYGTKSPHTVSRYLQQNMEFLLNRGVKAVVVACNSASSVLTADHGFGIPVYGVIVPGARSAHQQSRTGRIGILGTRTTVNSGVYVHALEKMNPEVYTVQAACPLLVPLVEEGWENESITLEIIEKYLAPMKEHHIDTLILGCTHYPVLKAGFRKVMGNDVKLIDSAAAIAEELSRDFSQGFVASREEHGGRIDMLATDDGAFFHKIASKLMHPHTINSWSIADLKQSSEKRTHEIL